MGYFDKIKKMLSSSTTLPAEKEKSSGCCSGHDHAADEQKIKDSGCCCDDDCGCDDDYDKGASGGCGCC